MKCSSIGAIPISSKRKNQGIFDLKRKGKKNRIIIYRNIKLMDRNIIFPNMNQYIFYPFTRKNFVFN